MTMPKPKWYCDPAGYRHDDCEDHPCRGHIATKEILLAADVLAWRDGEDYLAGVDLVWQQEYLDMAGECITERAKR